MEDHDQDAPDDCCHDCADDGEDFELPDDYDTTTTKESK